MARALEVNAVEAMRSVTLCVRVVGLRSLRVRTWITGRLFMLGALVLGCGIDVDLTGGGDGPTRTEG